MTPRGAVLAIAFFLGSCSAPTHEKVFWLESSIPSLRDSVVTARSTQTIQTLIWFRMEAPRAVDNTERRAFEAAAQALGCSSNEVCPESAAVSVSYRVSAGGGSVFPVSDRPGPGAYLALWTFGDAGEQALVVRAVQSASGAWIHGRYVASPGPRLFDEETLHVKVR